MLPHVATCCHMLPLVSQLCRSPGFVDQHAVQEASDSKTISEFNAGSSGVIGRAWSVKSTCVPGFMLWFTFAFRSCFWQLWCAHQVRQEGEDEAGCIKTSQWLWHWNPANTHRHHCRNCTWEVNAGSTKEIHKRLIICALSKDPLVEQFYSWNLYESLWIFRIPKVASTWFQPWFQHGFKFQDDLDDENTKQEDQDSVPPDASGAGSDGCQSNRKPIENP